MKNATKQVLVCFQSGHYKSFKGTWKGDSIWSHFVKDDGSHLHFNKDKIEYMEVKDFPKKEEKDGSRNTETQGND